MTDEPIYSQPSVVLRRVPSIYLRQRLKATVQAPTESGEVLQDIISRQQAYIMHLEGELRNLRHAGERSGTGFEKAQPFIRTKGGTNPSISSSPGSPQSPVAPPKIKRNLSKLRLEEKCRNLEMMVEEIQKRNKDLEEKAKEEEQKVVTLPSCRCPTKRSNQLEEGPEDLQILQHQKTLVDNFERLVKELRAKHESETIEREKRISGLLEKVDELTQSNKVLGELLLKAKTRIQELTFQKRDLQHRVGRMKASLSSREENLQEAETKLQNLVGWSQMLEQERDCIKGIARERVRAEAKLIKQCTAEALTAARLKQKLKQVYAK